MMRKGWLLVLLLLAPLAQAAGVHAFLDRSHVSLGDTVTLNIQSTTALGTPDLAPLAQDFEVLGSSDSSSVAIVNGKTTRTVQIGIALKPLRAGTLTIPALHVGSAVTQPLTLQVGAAPTGGSGKVGDPAFMQASVASSAPYVGQQTVYTVRLFYLPGVSGSLADPTANGARLVKLNADRDYLADRNGYTYKVIERSWALIPNRAGVITVNGPEFQGQQMGNGNLDALLNNPGALLNHPNALLNGQLPGFGTTVAASAPAVTLDARAAPAGAGQPWLPARNVQLKLTGLPANGALTAGAPLTLTLSISASGAPADALPEPQLPPLAGARVYPDQTQDATDASGEWLQGKRTRSFAIVPDRNGALTIPAITLKWWNVVADHAEQATLPAHTLQVSGVVAGATRSGGPAVTPPVASTAQAARPSAAQPPVQVPDASSRWRTVAVASFALWLLAIIAAGVWWWRSRARGVGVAIPSEATAPTVVTSSRKLQACALDAAHGADVAACERALLAWAQSVRPSVANLGALGAALADSAQRAALDTLQRTRWQGGDGRAACAAVAQAFARGFTWRAVADKSQAPADLPPLYPS
ncbi:MAG TPA: BatD family protein [Rhodanobacteraceae bacterium]